MSNTTISTEDKKSEPQKVSPNELTEAITTAMEIERIKKETEDLKKVYEEQQEVRAKLAMGGKAMAGQPQKSEKEVIDEEAKRLINIYR